MSLITLIVVLIIVGAGLYLVNNTLPIDPKFKTIINVVVVVAVLVWLAYAFLGLDTVYIGPRRPAR